MLIPVLDGYLEKHTTSLGQQDRDFRHCLRVGVPVLSRAALPPAMYFPISQLPKVGSSHESAMLLVDDTSQHVYPANSAANGQQLSCCVSWMPTDVAAGAVQVC